MDKLIRFILEETAAKRMDLKTGSSLIEMIRRNIQPETQDIAIIGMACRLPFADSVEAFWGNISKGINCVTSLPQSRRTDCEDIRAHSYLRDRDVVYTHGGYLDAIDGFDYPFFKLTASEAAMMDPNQRLFLETAWCALADSGYAGIRKKGLKIGIYAITSNTNVYGELVSRFYGSEPDAIIGNYASMTPSRLAYYLDLHGPAVLMDTSCSSSFSALHIASRAVCDSDCDIAVVGGVNLRALSIAQVWDLGVDASDYATKAFDEAADGAVWGEGVGVVVIRPLIKATSARDQIYSIIKGSAMNHDGRSIGITAPNVDAQEAMITEAWQRAGVNPETISYIEMHGTGTKLGDPIEFQSLKSAFEKHTKRKQFCAIGTVKTNIGHLDGVSGMAGLIKSVMALRHKKIPPLLHFHLPNSLMDVEDSPFYINTRLEEWENGNQLRRCGINSFGLSGTNCHVVLEEYVDNRNCENEGLGILTLSAAGIEPLRKLIESFAVFLQGEDVSWLDICFTASAGRDHYRYRVAVTAHTTREAAEKLRKIDLSDISAMPDGVLYGDIRTSKNVEKPSDDISLLQDFSQRYITGAYIDWQSVYPNQRIVSLPQYPFDRRRCWVTLPEPEPLAQTVDMKDELLFKMTWKEKQAAYSLKPPLKSGNSDTESRLLTIMINRGVDIADQTKRELEGRGHMVVVMDNETLDSVDECRRFFDSLGPAGQTRILFFSAEYRRVESLPELEKTLQDGVYSFYRLMKGMHESNFNGKVKITIIANEVNRVSPDGRCSPENAALAGLGKVVNFENAFIHTRCIDIDGTVTTSQLVDEIFCDEELYFTVMRDGKRYIQELKPAGQNTNLSSNSKLRPEPLLPAARCKSSGPIIFREKGTYLITGGLGGIGLEIGKWIADKAKVNFIFLNRTPMPQRSEWENLINNGDEKTIKKIKAILEMEIRGSVVECFGVDVADLQQVEDAVSAVKQRFGCINGVIHGAGVAGAGFLVNKEEIEIERVLRPKIFGTFVIDYVTKAEPLDFFILFSSGTSLFGDPGNGDYMAANSYLDAYTNVRQGNGRTLIISWTGWKETGMAKDNNVNTDAAFISMPTELALKGFAKTLENEADHLIIGKLNCKQATAEQMRQWKIPFALSQEISEILRLSWDLHGSETNNASPVTLEGDDIPHWETAHIIAQAWGQVFDTDNLHVEDNFFDLGGNSIMAVQVTVKLLRYELDIKEIIQNPTIGMLTKHVVTKDANNVARHIVHIENELSSFTPGAVAQKYVSEGIVPFNDVLFKDCFYNGFFSAASHIGVDVRAFMLYDFPLCRLGTTQDGMCLDILYESSMDMQKIAENKGIAVKSSRIGNDRLIDELRQALSRGCLAMVRVDAFYLPMRTDVYQNIHWNHSLLVYGYNNAKEQFNIFEHDSMNSLNYRPQILGYAEMREASQGYLDHFYKSIKELPLYIISAKNDVDKHKHTQAELFTVYMEELTKSWDKVSLNAENMKKYGDYYTNLEGNPLRAHQQFKFMINELLKMKLFEKYRYNIIGIKDGGCVDFIEKSIKLINWILFRIESVEKRNESLTNSDVAKMLTRLATAEDGYCSGTKQMIEEGCWS